MHTREKGQIGETIACGYLVSRGYKIVERNYQKKWGEIDIIATKDSVLHFVEVKSVTGTHALRFLDTHRPEDNVHALKGRHIGRMIETYLNDKGGGVGVEFHFHVLCVFMDYTTRRARIRWIQNVIL
jgi:Holliday junction resolvase-like predicted endonuclease